MEKTPPKSEEVWTLTELLIAFSTFASIHFVKTEIHSPADHKNDSFGCKYELELHIQNESEYDEIKEVVLNHFSHVKGVPFFLQFYIPSAKKHCWRKFNFVLIS